MVELSYAMAFKSCTSAGGPDTFTGKDCVALRLLGFVAVTEMVVAPGPTGVMVTMPGVDVAAVATPS